MKAPGTPKMTTVLSLKNSSLVILSFAEEINGPPDNKEALEQKYLTFEETTREVRHTNISKITNNFARSFP